jgi:hypothetical protein
MGHPELNHLSPSLYRRYATRLQEVDNCDRPKCNPCPDIGTKTVVFDQRHDLNAGNSDNIVF